jgi:hypothetical protein
MTPPVMTTTGHAPAVVFFVTAAHVSDVAETKTVVCGTPLTQTTLCLVKFVPVAVSVVAPTPDTVLPGVIDASAGAVAGDNDDACPAFGPAASVAAVCVGPTPSATVGHSAREPGAVTDTSVPAPSCATLVLAGTAPAAAPG